MTNDNDDDKTLASCRVKFDQMKTFYPTVRDGHPEPGLPQHSPIMEKTRRKFDELFGVKKRD